MPAGEPFSARQREEIVRAIQLARTENDLPVSVYVGPLEGEPRPAAEKLHGALGEQSVGSVLVAVDPGSRTVEIVTGSALRHRLDERACGLVALSMTTAFSAGDLAGGLAAGVRMLSDHARGFRVLHTDAPM